jgi:hypothetical protein
MNRATVFAGWIMALGGALAAGCGEPAPPRFFDGDASTAPDATGTTCTSNAQCDDRVACTRDLCLVGGVCEHMPDGPMCVTTPRCMRAADCDDRVPCTRDTCLVDGTCGHTAQSEMCPVGQASLRLFSSSAGSPDPVPASTPRDAMPAVTLARPACAAGSRRAPPSKSICRSTIAIDGLSTR